MENNRTIAEEEAESDGSDSRTAAPIPKWVITFAVVAVSVVIGIIVLSAMGSQHSADPVSAAVVRANSQPKAALPTPTRVATSAAEVAPTTTSIAARQPTPAPSPTPAGHYTTRNTFMFTTVDAAQTYDHLNPDDNIGFDELVATGELLVVDQGTTVLLLDNKGLYERVRLTSGKYIGQAGYIRVDRLR